MGMGWGSGGPGPDLPSNPRRLPSPHTDSSSLNYKSIHFSPLQIPPGPARLSRAPPPLPRS